MSIKNKEREKARFRGTPYIFTKSESQHIKDSYLDGVAPSKLAEEYGVSLIPIKGCLISQGITLRGRSEATKLMYKKYPEFGNRKRGADSPNWRGLRVVYKNMVLIWKPNHPRAKTYAGRVPEYILVWEEVHGHPLPEGWVVHHLNGIKTDNRPCNLLGMPKSGHHPKLVEEVLKKRIRELEAENKLLENALNTQQLIWGSEN